MALRFHDTLQESSVGLQFISASPPAGDGADQYCDQLLKRAHTKRPCRLLVDQRSEVRSGIGRTARPLSTHRPQRSGLPRGVLSDGLTTIDAPAATADATFTSPDPLSLTYQPLLHLGESGPLAPR
jgi:hypothetical protein